MKKILLFLIFLNIFSILYSQNLVPNSSFEDTLWCPFNTMQINAANHWFAPGGGVFGTFS